MWPQLAIWPAGVCQCPCPYTSQAVAGAPPFQRPSQASLTFFLLCHEL